MNFHTQFDRVHAFLLHLECLGPASQRDSFMNEVIENGGTYLPPKQDNWSSHLFEISLHGVSAYGETEDETIRNWKKAARAQVRLGDGHDFTTVDPPLSDTCGNAGATANTLK